MRRIYLICFFLVVIVSAGFSQAINIDPNQSYINVNTPKTPESAGFEKYGNAQVNEFTGTSSVSIPIYTLKSRFLEAPINLSYQATGIRVNQEASWVGLGWDLNVGGRITVEIKGCADFNGTTRGLTSASNLSAGMQQIFTRLGNSRETSVLTFATICEGAGCTDPSFYNTQAVSDMTQYGVGEPDIFRANFMGHSVTFYVDKISNAIKFLGEQSLFTINYTLDSFNNITGWTITDNDGIVYYFNQTETTTSTIPGSAIVPTTTTTAWLLTRVVHPTGDYLQYTYNNFGYSVPAFTMSGWVNWVAGSASATLSNDHDQNVNIQSPFYLTRVESADAAVDFTLNTRTDLYGPGSRKLTKVTVTDKITNTLKKTTTFNYSYFQSSFRPWLTYLNSLTYYLPSPLVKSDYLACSNSRLRLDSVYVNDSNYQPPYRFYYNSTVADKYEYSQDHWGYLNGGGNSTNGYTFTHLIPYLGIGGVQNTIPAANLAASNIGFSRDCDPFSMQAMVLNKVAYPTGGSSEFTYEPHQSTMVTAGVTGGGLRIKTIKNYSFGNLTGTTNYTYGLGKYMGNIRYYTDANELTGASNITGQMKYSSNGTLNADDILVGYAQTIITQTGPSGRSNGSLAKSFDVETSSSIYANGGSGYDIAPPYFPSTESPPVFGFQTYDFWLDAAHKYFPPTPTANLEGKLTEEQYFDSSNILLKSISYYYRLANYTKNFYDVTALQNRDCGFSCSGTHNGGWGSGGDRPVILFVSPAKSFHILLDSTIEITYSGSSSITHKKAFQYNSYYQPQYESDYNSDGTQTITYTQTSASLTPNYSLAPQGDAILLQAMKSAHIYDLPIEQTIIHRGTAGDSTMISSRLNIYKGSLPLKVFLAETAQPLTLRTQFVPSFYTYTNYPNSPGDSWDSLKPDTHYKLYNVADYSTHNQVRTLHALQGNTTYIWDEDYNDILAQCTNTDSVNVAFTSFETNATGRWSYSQAAVIGHVTPPTGDNAFNLSTGVSISTVSLLSANTYIVSYWSRTGTSYSVTGSTSVKQGKTINSWTYFEHTVTGTTSVTISGTGRIDEVRLYPSTSQMISYTYSPLIGMTSQCDADNRITYYAYDAIGRLKWIKDQDGNIIKTIQYHFQGISGTQY